MPGQHDSHPQNMSALAHATAIRSARCQLRRDVKADRVLAADVVISPPECAQNMTIGDLLGAQRRWGAGRVEQFCAALGLPETKVLESFTDRQRLVLAAELPKGGGRLPAVFKREDAERAERAALCDRLNGNGPCLHKAGHSGECVTAAVQPTMVTFHGYESGEQIARHTRGNRPPSTLDLAAMLQEATAWKP